MSISLGFVECGLWDFTADSAGALQTKISRWGSEAWFRVSSFGFRVSSFGFRVSGCLFRASGFQALGSGFWVSGFWYRDSGFGFWFSGFRFRVSGSRFVFQVSVLNRTIACEMNISRRSHGLKRSTRAPSPSSRFTLAT